MDPARRATIEASRRGLSLMFDLLGGTNDFANTFQAAYGIDGNSPGALGHTIAKPACGGCPDCRAHQRDPTRATEDLRTQCAHPATFVSPTLASLSTDGSSSPLLITVDPQTIRPRRRWRTFDDLVTALVRHGIRLISAPAHLLEHLQCRVPITPQPTASFLEPNPANVFAPKIASLIVHDPLQESAVLPPRYLLHRVSRTRASCSFRTTRAIPTALTNSSSTPGTPTWTPTPCWRSSDGTAQPPTDLADVLRVLVRTLQGTDSFTMSVEDLAHLTVPSAALASNTDGLDGSKGFDDTLTACVFMGIVTRDGSIVALSEEFSWLRDHQLSDERFRMHLTDRIFDTALNNGLW